MFGLLKKKNLNREQLRASLESLEFVVIDTELTGLDPRKDSIVSIGAIQMKGHTILLGDIFYRVVAPSTDCSKTVTVHGITPEETNHCPELEIVLPEFLRFIGNRIVVGHHVKIDIVFLNRALRILNIPSLDNPAVDTFKIYSWLKKLHIAADAFYEPRTVTESLFEIARIYEIDVQNIHHALYDAFITAQLFQRFLHELKLKGVKTLKDLLLISS